MTSLRRCVGLLILLGLAGCGQPHPASAAASAAAAGEAPVLNVYNWYDYIKPEVLRQFQARYGITVHYNVFDSDDTLATRLLAGHSGYDVVFPSGAYLDSLMPAGVFRTLDKTRLPNLANMDPQIMRRLAAQDPGNAHAVVYTWGITGFAYDAGKISARLPAAPVDSWSMLFDPKVAAHLADCGIGLYEAPHVIVPSVLAWLGEPPNSEDPRNLADAQRALMAVRGSIRKISTGSLVDDLASGQLCLIIASNGDAMQAQERARITRCSRTSPSGPPCRALSGIAAKGEQIRFSIPREGAVLWFDVAAIPADAPHPGNALLFINFLMDPAIAAQNSNSIRFPNGNLASQPQVLPELRNATIFPQGALAARLIPELAKSQPYVRLRTRMWTRFRTGQ